MMKVDQIIDILLYICKGGRVTRLRIRSAPQNQQQVGAGQPQRKEGTSGSCFHWPLGRTEPNPRVAAAHLLLPVEVSNEQLRALVDVVVPRHRRHWQPTARWQ
jgi:hypothetical protein